MFEEVVKIDPDIEDTRFGTDIKCFFDDNKDELDKI